MAKSNNLFTADDFSKDGGKKSSAIWIIIAIVVIVAIILAIIFLKKDKSDSPKVSEPAKVEQVVNIPAETAKPEQPAQTTPKEEAPVAPAQTQASIPAQTQPVAPAQPAPKATTSSSTSKQYSGDLSILNGKSLTEKANIIIRGTFGNNPDRRNALGAAYEEIQNKVNEMYRNGEVD